MLCKASGRSLVVIDEFGKGTLPCDGVGLLAACLHHFSALQPPPMVLACTHFSELYDPAVLSR